jgi:biopolymer transport protein ExbB
MRPAFFCAASALSPAASALTQGEIFDGALALVRLGGPVVAVLLAMSVVALAVSAWKTLQLGRLARGGAALDGALEHWVRGDAERALAALARAPGPSAALLAEGMRWLEEEREPERVREELVRRAQQQVGEAGNLMGLLEQVVYLAPLLGLLGTVLGIIEVFQGLAVDASAANAGSLAGGIWEALLTTAVGLCVAIPFALVHSLLENRIERLHRRTEDRLGRLFTVSLYRAS